MSRVSLPRTASLVLLLSSLISCYAEKRVVHSCSEILAALKDPAVDHVLMMPSELGYNCTAADLPPNSVEIKGREVVLEGHGPDIYVDMNRLTAVVWVSEGGRLEQRNFWSDDCMQAEPPFMCFVRVLAGGSLALTDMQLSDTGCVDVHSSKGIAFMAWTMRFSKMSEGGYEHRYSPDNRTLFVRDTGWMEGMPAGTNWRATNTTFTCTGNVTHHLAADKLLVETEHFPTLQRGLLLAGTGVLLAMALGVFRFARNKARDSQLPEYKIAASYGFKLEAPLGSGHFGRVYRGRSRSSGQPVAVKVIELLPTQRRQVLSAWRECQLMSHVQHDCIVRVITFYSAQVQQRRYIVEPTPGNEYVELGYNVAVVTDGDGSLPPLAPSTKVCRGFTGSMGSDGSLSNESGSCSSGSGSGSAGQASVWRQLQRRLLLPPDNSSGASVSSAGNGSTSGTSGLEGTVSLQVQLVMQYCDMGTLEEAIKQGVFLDGVTGQPKLRHILLTALEVAQGLSYLHHTDRRLVHRDLSCTNVLLVTHTDERGFRALLSDFGLSTALAEDATHKTSEVKGTISYMSPEVFMHDDVSPALDVYSLGIIMHMMYEGRDPYSNQTPAMIILNKVRATGNPTAARLPAMKGCPQELQQLVWDCTHYSRQSRPTAAMVVERLQAML